MWEIVLCYQLGRYLAGAGVQIAARCLRMEVKELAVILREYVQCKRLEKFYARSLEQMTSPLTAEKWKEQVTARLHAQYRLARENRTLLARKTGYAWVFRTGRPHINEKIFLREVADVASLLIYTRLRIRKIQMCLTAPGSPFLEDIDVAINYVATAIRMLRGLRVPVDRVCKLQDMQNNLSVIRLGTNYYVHDAIETALNVLYLNEQPGQKKFIARLDVPFALAIKNTREIYDQLVRGVERELDVRDDTSGEAGLEPSE